jgi:hypothetical protein
MSLASYTDKKLKKLDWMDISLIKMACFAFGVLLVRLIPGLMEVNIWLIIAVWLILAVKPIFQFFSK